MFAEVEGNIVAEMTHAIREKFKSLYDTEPVMFRSPGRVNLIGEHTDYNEGYVLPAAINKEAVFAVSIHDSSTCKLYAKDLNESYEFDLNDLKKSEDCSWANYLIGVVAQFAKAGQDVKGFNCVFGSTVPLGAGLSSSAAIECGMAYALNELNKFDNDLFTLVKMAQKAEHEYAGVQCGIMDQFASGFGKEGHLVRLDCRSHEYQYVPFDLPDYRIVLINTMVKHSLASSEYNTRRQECEQGVAILQKHYPDINSLRDVTPEIVEKHKDELPEKVYDRCIYVTNENRRVEEACLDLEKGDIKAFGEKMYECHEGLSKRYEVSCKELDFLVEKSKYFDQVIGSRMMGGGFGGCTINLVKEYSVEAFVEEMTKAYIKEYNVNPEVYVAQIANGSSYA